ncbi:MAG: hypothetical protein WCO93_07740 [bacterium]
MLKKKIAAVMLQTYPGMNPSISEWKGQEITDFQEDLRQRVSANISEKWFYTHIKSSQATLPRIDMLNLLSKYAGYSNWNDFIFKNKETLPATAPGRNANRYFIIIPVLSLVILIILFGLFKLFDTQKYRFCFYDADTREPISGGNVEVALLLDGESPEQHLCGPDGCFTLSTDKSIIRMVVASPYYQTDTIVRTLKKLNHNETITLRANDYALMIHYFSMMKVDDWEKRKTKLNEIIGEDAMICQVFNGREASGMALYNKTEFINKMTMPSGNLKSIEILSSQVKNGKIVVLRFRINEKKK